MTTTTPTIIETITPDMEIGETRSDEAGTAFRAGERIARKYRAQGHACECIGVVEREGDMAIERDMDHKIPTGLGMYTREHRTTYVRRTFFHPVIFPKAVEGEE